VTLFLRFNVLFAKIISNLKAQNENETMTLLHPSFVNTLANATETLIAEAASSIDSEVENCRGAALDAALAAQSCWKCGCVVWRQRGSVGL
jgi:hypothetical protein